MVVFEPVAYGHSFDHLSHLTDYLSTHESRCQVSFVVDPSLEDVARRRLGGTRHRVLPVSDVERERSSRSLPVARSMDRWRILADYLERLRPDAAHVMMLDELQLPLALRLPVPDPTEITGVLFRPCLHYRSFGENRSSVASRLRHLRKNLLHRALLGHPRLGTVFSLDPLFAPYAREHLTHGRKVVTLPDPVLFDGRRTAGYGEASREKGHASVPPNRSVFLMFGSLTERKGVFPLLQSLSRLDARTAERAAVILAGTVPQDLKSQVANAVSGVRAARPKLWLEVWDRRLPEEELEELVGDADVILAPYQDFIGSSGIMMWAAGAVTPIITQQYGLLGELCRRHCLGLAVDTGSPKELAGAITDFVVRGEDLYDPERIRQFAARKTPHAFADTIFTEVCR